MQPGATAPTLIQSLQRGMLLIEAVTERGPMTARALSDTTGIVLPTTYHLLRTLVHEDYLRREDDCRYALGSQLTSVTQLECRARSVRLIHEAMTTFADEARATVTIGRLDDAEIVVSQTLTHPSSPRFECWPGMTLPGHATAIGKSILFQMRPQRRECYLETHPLDALTNQTATTNRRLEEELAQGPLAHSDQQYLYGISCTATIVTGGHGLTALGAAFSFSRSIRLRDRIDNLISIAASEISDALSLAASSDPGAGSMPPAPVG